MDGVGEDKCVREHGSRKPPRTPYLALGSAQTPGPREAGVRTAQGSRGLQALLFAIETVTKMNFKAVTSNYAPSLILNSA